MVPDCKARMLSLDDYLVGMIHNHSDGFLRRKIHLLNGIHASAVSCRRQLQINGALCKRLMARTWFDLIIYLGSINIFTSLLLTVGVQSHLFSQSPQELDKQYSQNTHLLQIVLGIEWWSCKIKIMSLVLPMHVELLQGYVVGIHHVKVWKSMSAMTVNLWKYRPPQLPFLEKISDRFQEAFSKSF